MWAEELEAQGTRIDLVNRIITFDTHPHRATVIDHRWIDPQAGWDAIPNYYGAFFSKDDIDNGEPHVVSERDWMTEPRIGRCFYGLISYEERATPSDIMKGRNLVTDNGRVVEDGKALRIEGDIRKWQLGYYLSHPILHAR
jgi:hypothetical protein